LVDNINLFKIKTKEVLNEINSNNDKNNNNGIISMINDPEVLLRKILEELNEIRKNTSLFNTIKSLKKIEFEKDIPELGHIQFIHSYANLKAKSYNIPICDKFYTLEYVGKIAPTTITSTAVVAGFMCLQMIGIIINQLFIWPKKK
jgi:ubiquitin-activating enzyme E1